jgi:rare lipoprotein A
MTMASWYGPGFQGHRTSSGQIFNRNRLTAASRTLPLGSRVRVTNPDNGSSVVVRINDRGPYVRGRGIDLSEGAAERIGVARRGVARVRVVRLEPAAQPRDAPRTLVSERQKKWRYSYHHAYYRRRPSRQRYDHHRTTHHYYYASVVERRRQPRMVASPVGDWLLGMLR